MVNKLAMRISAMAPVKKQFLKCLQKTCHCSVQLKLTSDFFNKKKSNYSTCLMYATKLKDKWSQPIALLDITTK